MKLLKLVLAAVGAAALYALIVVAFVLAGFWFVMTLMNSYSATMQVGR